MWKYLSSITSCKCFHQYIFWSSKTLSCCQGKPTSNNYDHRHIWHIASSYRSLVASFCICFDNLYSLIYILFISTYSNTCPTWNLGFFKSSCLDVLNLNYVVFSSESITHKFSSYQSPSFSRFSFPFTLVLLSFSTSGQIVPICIIITLIS